jgi:hypothetical protein
MPATQSLEQERNHFHEEAHHERSGEKKNCGCSAGTLGEAEACLVLNGETPNAICTVNRKAGRAPAVRLNGSPLDCKSDSPPGSTT